MRLGETSSTGADNGPLGVLGLAPMARSIIPPSPSITAGTPQLGPGAGLHTPASKARPPPPTPPTGATTSQQLAFAATTCPNTLTPCAVRLCMVCTPCTKPWLCAVCPARCGVRHLSSERHGTDDAQTVQQPPAIISRTCTSTNQLRPTESTTLKYRS